MNESVNNESAPSLSFMRSLSIKKDVTFSSEKPESLPNKVVKYLTQYLNVKDLGNLKKMTRFRKNEVNKYLNEIFKNILHK